MEARPAQDVRIEDIGLSDGREAFVVAPVGGGAGLGILFLHGFDTEAPDGNRTQFRDEAVALAREHGATAVLPQGRFPWSEAPTIDRLAFLTRVLGL